MIKAKMPPENPDANLKSYTETHRLFTWEDAHQAFTWHQSGKLNIVHEAVDRWADDETRRNRNALIFEKGGKVQHFTYEDLSSLSCQWANLLTEYGFTLGDRVFIFLPPCPEVYLAFLACARLGVIFCVLFPSSGFDEIDARIRSARPRGIITHPALAEGLPVQAMDCVEHVFLTAGSKRRGTRSARSPCSARSRVTAPAASPTSSCGRAMTAASPPSGCDPPMHRCRPPAAPPN